MDGCEATNERRVDDPYLGRIVANVFRLELLIGLGTTGRVYRATQLGFERSVAVKILHRHLMVSPAVRERFHREARLASRLRSPGIVSVLASGELDRAGPDCGGEAFLVSEYLEGENLRTLLDAGQPVAIARSVSLLIAAADAVGEAHSQRIVHRDLKPENMMLVASKNEPPRLVVLDFGLARALDHEQAPLTHDGAVLGTPQYMSPEAARGQTATPQSDVYSLATVLYELLAGRPPFTADSPMMILMQKAEMDPPSLDAAVPDPLRRFVMRELDKVPTRRCADARSFAVDLYAAASCAGLAPSEILMPQLSDEILDKIATL